jgi:hypothetical protein
VQEEHGFRKLSVNSFRELMLSGLYPVAIAANTSGVCT